MAAIYSSRVSAWSLFERVQGLAARGLTRHQVLVSAIGDGASKPSAYG